jgi:hypothetical protein
MKYELNSSGVKRFLGSLAGIYVNLSEKAVCMHKSELRLATISLSWY